MDWTNIYLKTYDLNVFVLGTGEVATRRANTFLDHGANVRLAGNYLDPVLEYKGAHLCSTDDVDELVKWADIVVVASDDLELCDYVSEISKDKLLNRADFPQEGNVMVPSSFKIGEDIEISISTNGKSPLMAKQLRKKIQEVITEEDILEIEIQDYVRSKLKDVVRGQKQRKDYLYKIFEDEKVKDLVRSKDMDQAKSYVDELIRGLQ